MNAGNLQYKGVDLPVIKNTAIDRQTVTIGSYDNHAQTNHHNSLDLQYELQAQGGFFKELSSKQSSTELFTKAQRLAYLEKYGRHCMSSSTLQPNMRFFDCPGVGYIAYQDKWGERIVLSDPIAAPEHQSKILELFIACSHKPVSFVHISKTTAEILSQKLGFFSTAMGHENEIKLSEWKLSGKKKQIFRTALNQAQKQQIEIRENPSETANATLSSVSEQWLQTRNCKQKHIEFLIRPETLTDESHVRKFYAYQNNQIIAFIYFDPIYRENKIIGYVPNISRANQSFKQGLFYAMMATALQQFKEEGVEIINLGLTPLVPTKVSDSNNIKSSKWLERLFKLTYRFGQSFYNFSGIHFTKSRFRAQSHPCYVASNKRIPMKAFLACLRLCNVI